MMTLLNRFREQTLGMVAAEFALLIPALVMLFAGVVELSNMTIAGRKALRAAQSVGDLLAQEVIVSDEDVTNVFKAAQLIMEPFPTDTLQVGAASVRYDDDDGSPYVDWEESYNSGSINGLLSMAADMGEAGESVLVVGVTYEYEPVFLTSLIGNSMTIEEEAVLKPRRVAYVTRE